MSRTETGTVVSGHDGTRLSVLSVYPEGAPRAVLQIAHGMCEYKERYLPLMEYLAERGIACVIGDHRGHGQSAGGEENYGYFGRDGAKGLVSDLSQLILETRERFPGIPLYLMGHSMGSLVARAYLKQEDGVIQGLVLCGCPGNQPGTGAGRALAKSLAAVKGERFRSQQMNRLVFSSFVMKFRDEGSDNAWVCSDPEVVRAYDGDPACGFTFTLNGFLALFDLLDTVYSERGWKAEHRRLPVWFISGEEDPCMVSRRRLMEAIGLLQYAGYENVTYRLYPGMRHEILNEREKMTVYEDLLGTLERWNAQELPL